MPRLSREQRVIRQIVKGHGSVIDLTADPERFIEIVRKYGPDLLDAEPGFPPDGGGGPTGPGARLSPDGGASPGGVGPVGPTSFQAGPRIDDVMKEVLKLQRQVAKLTKQFGP